MATIAGLDIESYRSIEGPFSIDLPPRCPLVLLGENNSGKSNVVKALDLVLGNFWPGSHEPDDHEFFDRDRERDIRITIRFAPDDPFGRGYRDITWSYNPITRTPDYRGFPDPHGRDRGYISGEDRDSCVCGTLHAERDLHYQLSYRSKYTLLSKLMHKFHGVLHRSPDTREALLQLFEQVKQRFQEIEPFREFTTQLQTQLGDFIASMTHRLQVDFEAYNPVNFFHALRLQAAEGDTARVLDEMGTGEQQVLALSFAYAYACAFHGGIVLVVEEPESHLHPLAQQWLAKRLGVMCEGGLQAVITTHSPHFIDLLNLEGLVLVKKENGRTRPIQLRREELVERCLASGAPPDRVRVETILPFYKASATPAVLEGFFAKLVVLVEGPTETLSLPVLLEAVGFNVAKMGVAVVPVHGKSSLAKWRRLFHAYEIPTYVICDNDLQDDRLAAGRRDALAAVGLPVDDHDGVITAHDWIIEGAFCVFGQNYETCLRHYFPGYTALEALARDEGVTAKPFLARWVAARLERDEAPGWERLETLGNRLRAFLPDA